MFVIYLLPEETSLDTDVSFFNFKKISALNAAMNLLGLKLDFSFPLNSNSTKTAITFGEESSYTTNVLFNRMQNVVIDSITCSMRVCGLCEVDALHLL